MKSIPKLHLKNIERIPKIKPNHPICIQVFSNLVLIKWRKLSRYYIPFYIYAKYLNLLHICLQVFTKWVFNKMGEMVSILHNYDLKQIQNIKITDTITLQVFINCIS